MTNRRTNRRSPGRAAIAVLAAIAVPLTACSDDDDASPVIDLTTDSVGTCLQIDDDVGDEITELPTVDSATSHTHEIFALVTSTAKTYPGFEGLEAEAQAKCFSEFEPYVGINPVDSDLFYQWLVPTLNSWDKETDRQIVCVIGNQNGAPLIGSVEGSQR